MASLHPQHVGSDSNVWRGNPIDLVQRLQSAARDAEALTRAQDLRFALDQVLASDHGRLIDVTQIAVAGHSYGANTAMLVAGAQVNTDRANLAELKDQRIRAAILISAPPLLGQGPAQQVLGAVTTPTLHITSLEDTINLPGYRSTVEDRIAIFEAMKRSPRTLAIYNKGGHSIFTDRTTRSGPETSARIKVATQELCTIFLRQSLRFAHPQVNAVLQDNHKAQHGITQWAYRHKNLLDQLVTRET
jgi:predicted dienelactone hydrolase